MKHTLKLAVFLALVACAPKAEAPKAEASKTEAAAPAEAPVAPDVAAAAAAGQPDPRIPTVDPASITTSSTVADVMHAYVIPGSESLFAAESAAPANDAEWTKLQKAAQDVITGTEMLKATGRSKGDGWNKTIDTVVAATKVTAEALGKKNADDLVFTNGDMMAGCTACHQQFRDLAPPPGHLIEQKAN